MIALDARSRIAQASRLLSGSQGGTCDSSSLRLLFRRQERKFLEQTHAVLFGRRRMMDEAFPPEAFWFRVARESGTVQGMALEPTLETRRLFSW